MTADHGGGGAEIFDACVGAGAEEDDVDGDVSRSGTPGLRSMYSSARAKLLRSASERASSTEGTFASMEVTMPGEVPQVTRGARVEASIVISRSKIAPSSVT